ncbi:hypothetical protein MCEL_12750 [Mycolicibacterium celeriflavum]|uniref:Uncharacterized protein n=1 Tax=Mycolicibacterium celeriflavum TaxID=1249101 RepID=A0A7I7RF64_MYCCF|nr:hypothetical protein MCEL_12750 [Mycolicibacterium celeriflavum]
MGAPLTSERLRLLVKCAREAARRNQAFPYVVIEPTRYSAGVTGADEGSASGAAIYAFGVLPNPTTIGTLCSPSQQAWTSLYIVKSFAFTRSGV